MTKAYFDLSHKSQDIGFDPSTISGSYDGLRSFFNIFLTFSIRLPEYAKVVEIISMSSKLKLQNPNLELSECFTPIGISSSSKEIQSGEWFHFSLDEKAIHAIEKFRKDDCHFVIELTILASVINQDFYAKGGIVKTKAVNLFLSISRSDWAEKIFPKFGYHRFKLIEIPLTHETLVEAYSEIITEFNHAEDYFKKTDYNKCVAHCRHALDALKRNLKKIKDNEESETNFKWLKKIDEATFTWIDELDKANSLVTSKAHHAGLKKEFSRFEAESIYLVTLGLLNYIGHIDKN